MRTRAHSNPRAGTFAAEIRMFFGCSYRAICSAVRPGMPQCKNLHSGRFSVNYGAAIKGIGQL
jgi:hypothetical protein